MRALVLLALLAAAPCFGQTGSATLSCTPPTQNTDGTPLTNLASYRYYWGTSPGSLPYSRTEPESAGCGAVIASLTPATWYFAVTAIDTNGGESSFSNLATKTIPGTTPSGRVTAAGPVFNLAITTNSLVMLEAGSVAAGVTCDDTQQIAFGGKLYMRVDASRVTPFAGQQILTAWATCQ